MANRAFIPGNIRTLDTDIVELFGSVLFAASSAITSTDCFGFSVAALGTGTFTITLEDAYPSLIGATLTPLHASATDTGWQIIAQSPTTKSITIRNAPGGAATAPATGSSLYIRLVLRNTGAPRKGV